MKKITKLFVLLSTITFLSGCASSNSNNTNPDIDPDPGDGGGDIVIPENEDTEWQEFSQDKVNIANLFLTKALEVETSVISNTITNGLIAEGSDSYLSYSFLKGKLSNGELACYHQTPTKTTYYYYEGESINGYIENNSDGNKTYSKASNCVEKKFDGYDMSSLMVKPSGGTYGGYASLKKMFDNGSANTNKDTQFMIKKNGFDMKYAIYSKVTYTYWDAEISARFSDEGVLTNLRYKYVESYAKNVDKNEDGTFTFKPDAVLDYKETIYQAQTGELGTLELSVNPNNFYYSSYDIYSGTTKVNEGDTISPELCEDGVVLDVKNALPSTATSAFDNWTISTKQEGKKANTEDNYFEQKESKIYLSSIRTSGTYSVSISTKNITKTFTVYIGAIAPKSISFAGIKEDTRGASIIDIKSTITVDEKTNICAYINPIEANQDISFTVTPSEGISKSDYSLVEHSFATTNATLKYYTFSSTKTGTFVFTATANEDSSITSTHTLKVITPLTSDEVYSGKYCLYDTYRNTVSYTFEFTPNKSTDALDGECKITVASTGKYGIYTYSAAASSKKISLTYKADVEGATEVLYKVSLTSGGTRSSVDLTCSDSPVEWETTYTLLDWDDYLTSYK